MLCISFHWKLRESSRNSKKSYILEQRHTVFTLQSAYGITPPLLLSPQALLPYSEFYAVVLNGPWVFLVLQGRGGGCLEGRKKSFDLLQ